jgi:hypothetical protein
MWLTDVTRYGPVGGDLLRWLSHMTCACNEPQQYWCGGGSVESALQCRKKYLLLTLLCCGGVRLSLSLAASRIHTLRGLCCPKSEVALFCMTFGS